MDTDLALRLFVSVVRQNSFSKGGARLGVPQSSCSRLITKLEERLSTRLIQRSTRSLKLTEAGAIYFERAQQIIAALDDAKSAVQNSSRQPKGLLRVTAPVAIGSRYIAPMLPEFTQNFPDIRIDLSLTESVEDIVSLGFDVAIRFGDLSDSTLTATKLVESASVLCASPGYLAQRDRLTSPQEINSHACLVFKRPTEGNRWVFRKGAKTVEVPVSGTLLCNSTDAIVEAAIGGMGLCFVPEMLVEGHLQSGALEPALGAAWQDARPNPIYAVLPQRAYVPSKSRVFVDFLKSKMRSRRQGSPD